jgi:NAD(P)-dependent dehydrogenase (short-subunit alcohol dehydrogenase family)
MKGAVEVLSRAMALELDPRRIAVNVVAPGPVATDFSGGVVRDNPALNKRIAEKYSTRPGRCSRRSRTGDRLPAVFKKKTVGSTRSASKLREG